MEKINEVDEIFKQLDEVCKRERSLTDEQLSKELDKVYEKIPIKYFIQHQKSKYLIDRRVKKYCNEHNIELKDYRGPLPYRMYMIPVK